MLCDRESVRFSSSTWTDNRAVGPIWCANSAGSWTPQGMPLSDRVVRYSACDAQADPPEFVDGTMVQPFYTLGDQLFVEPQPHAVPDAFDLERPIRMSQAEVAVACSHIGIWKTIAQSSALYSLVLEDDVWFERGFGRILDQAWREMEDADRD